MVEIIYPSIEKIIGLNLFAITYIEVKKSDRAELLSKPKLSDAIEKCKSKDGDIYDKSVELLKWIIKNHPFASGNRRTAILVLKWFLLQNKKRFNISVEPRVLQGIRENYYSDEEIKRWIQHGEIRNFNR